MSDSNSPSKTYQTHTLTTFWPSYLPNHSQKLKYTTLFIVLIINWVKMWRNLVILGWDSFLKWVGKLTKDLCTMYIPFVIQKLSFWHIFGIFFTSGFSFWKGKHRIFSTSLSIEPGFHSSNISQELFMDVCKEKRQLRI